MIKDIRALYNKGQFEAAYALLDHAVATHPDDLQLGRDVGVFIHEHAVFHKFKTAVSGLAAYLPSHPTDYEAHIAHAFTAWVSGLNNECVASCTRAIALRHDVIHPYHILGLYYLNRQEYLPAFTTLAAGMLFCAPADKETLRVFLMLAAAMLRDLASFTFAFDGFNFTFKPTCFNAMAVETSAAHLQSLLCEAEELRLIRAEAAGCRRIVECGCLVGNHTLYFAKALRPEKIIVLDASTQSLEQTRHNFSLNPDVADVVLDLRHRAISTETGMIELLGYKVKAVVLDEEIQEPVDFIKIDVDGMEMAALEGLRLTIGQYRPKIMIEVSNEFAEQFRRFIHEFNYVVRQQIVRGGDGNYLISPAEGWRPLPANS
ncbi:MAG: FkbM family methyltransferase [Opitutus sp.]|nr:FkbM family methyltransferase [Opitutus sp.]MCS6245995.1 FkbM family methyltransferase [Opitutus sp.]MCS6273351.1 FkbM family methyltransferase [Opitutus sp.]MCS6277134.1 FkbM family methyltransferase [Opitutus sp.]MCS6300256.1 FkbM family methyltransferase [Opitutus sp.]